MLRRSYRPGDLVIYQKLKYSERPGPRAKNVYAAPEGEQYTYTVDKFWIVRELHRDGTLLVQTRSGKVHVLDASDSCLRHASLWERLLHRARFPAT